MNSQLNRELETFEYTREQHTHVLSSEPVYNPGRTTSVDVDEEREDRRLTILRATEARWARMDQEIQSHCGGRKKT